MSYLTLSVLNIFKEIAYLQGVQMNTDSGSTKSKLIVGRPDSILSIIKGENLCVTGPYETIGKFHP